MPQEILNGRTQSHGSGVATGLCGGLAAAVLVAAIGVLPACKGTDAKSPAPAQVVTVQPSAATHVRIGTYDSRSVAIAYARSEQFGRSIRELKRKHKEAVAAGDTQLAEKLENEGQSQQRRLHLQGFSTAPVEDCLEAVRDGLPGVARRKGVTLITSMADWHDPAAELVDVTDEIAALFKPDAKTLEIIASMRAQKPMPIEAAAKIPDNE